MSRRDTSERRDAPRPERGRAEAVCWGLVVVGVVMGFVAHSPADAQDAISPPAEPAKATPAEAVPPGAAAPQTPITVNPVEDREIQARLEGIFRGIQEQTDWFEAVEVRVENGVVYLTGRATGAEHQQWATALAQKTEDVVAVVNRMELAEGSVWDLSPAGSELRELWRQTVQIVPLVGVGVVILFLAWLAAKGAARLSGAVLERRMQNHILRGVITKAIAIPVFLLGLYIVLRVAGLTRLAVTVLGGTGLIGLVIGIAFRDIAENFLASLLISQQNPFRPGDLIEINGHTGYVQKVTTRGTVLMAFDGTYIQIPNATVYKSTIINYTANPSMRLSFTIGIGYDDPIPHAQEVALRVLREHPVVLGDPEPMIIAERLGPAAVELGVYFWIDSTTHSFLRVKSSVMRLVKRAFQDAGISLPDEAREMIFPRGVPVHIIGPEDGQAEARPARASRPAAPESEVTVTAAEGELRSEAGELQSQARRSRLPEEGADLLRADGPRQAPSERAR